MSPSAQPPLSVWTQLWQADPVLYVTLVFTGIINNALVTLFLVAVFCVVYDMFRFWLSRRTRQTFTHQMTKGNSPTGSLRKLTRDSHGYSSAAAVIITNATYSYALFLYLQFIASQLMVQIAHGITDATITNKNLRRRCNRLHARGLECSTAIRYHDALRITTPLVILFVIRGFQLHVEVPQQRTTDMHHSLSILELQSICRQVAQRLLAAPIAVVQVYTRAARQRPWSSCSKLLLVQTAISSAIFLLGNFICLLAALPDIQGSMRLLEVLGILRYRGM